MSAYLIGRGDDAAQILIGDQFKNVSRRHAELKVIDAATCRLEDLDSANGTEVFDKRAWLPIKRVVVTLDHRVRFGGEFETTVRDLLQMAKPRPQKHRESGGLAPEEVPPSQRNGHRMPPPVPPETPDLLVQPEVEVPTPPPPNKGAGNVMPETQQTQGPLTVVIENFWGHRAGAFNDFKTVLRSPVQGTLDLVNNPNFKNHKTFLVACTTVAVAAQTQALDWLGFSNSKSNGWLSRSMAFTLLQYTVFLAVFLLGYGAFKKVSLRRRSAREYFRLTCLSGGLTALYKALIPVLALAAMFALDGSQVGLGAYFVVAAALGIGIIIYDLRLQAAFWSLSYWKVVPISLILALLGGFVFLLGWWAIEIWIPARNAAG